MHRTEISDECVPNKLDQTTKYTPTILVSQSNVGISTTTEAIEVISTKRVDVKAANIVYEIGKTIMAGDPVQVTGDKLTIKTDSNMEPMEPPIYPVGSSQGIEITSCAQDATEEIPQEIEETSFSISGDQTFPRKDREIKDQSDSKKPLLLGHEKSPPLEKFANTTTVIIESRDKNGDMNTASGQTSRSIAEPDESCELCNCDSPGWLCDYVLIKAL
ncbi:hypothetical protein MAR_038345 [Mya arenaria]|uniref:Uncharacterized protein n=1 Tax=Mya arenaria TaxID=6604 RepID=A0ABY7FV01_MYAAR|nr:hypothetical protein MAR_038345 [Mya arenaria]